MTLQRQAELEKRWQECERQIQAIHAGKVVDGDSAELEGKLLEEQDAQSITLLTSDKSCPAPK
jgi:hypothetical protein